MVLQRRRCHSQPILIFLFAKIHPKKQCDLECVDCKKNLDFAGANSFCPSIAPFFLFWLFSDMLTVILYKIHFAPTHTSLSSHLYHQSALNLIRSQNFYFFIL